MTVTQIYVYDTLAALSQVAGMSTKIDPNKIILAGHSAGAEVAPTICKMAASKVKGCILLASVVKSFDSIIPWQYYYLTSLPNPTYATMNGAQLKASAACYNDLESHLDPGYIRSSACATYYTQAQKYYQSYKFFEPPPKVVEQLTMPVFVGQGTADYNVPYNLQFGPGGFSTYGYEFLKEISFMSSPGGWNAMFSSSTRVTLKVYQDLCHLFYKIKPTAVGLSTPDLEGVPNLHVDKPVIDDLATWIKTKI
jgi:acetyl esterase/lipase